MVDLYQILAKFAVRNQRKEKGEEAFEKQSLLSPLLLHSQDHTPRMYAFPSWQYKKYFHAQRLLERCGVRTRTHMCTQTYQKQPSAKKRGGTGTTRGAKKSVYKPKILHCQIPAKGSLQKGGCITCHHLGKVGDLHHSIVIGVQNSQLLLDDWPRKVQAALDTSFTQPQARPHTGRQQQEEAREQTNKGRLFRKRITRTFGHSAHRNTPFHSVYANTHGHHTTDWEFTRATHTFSKKAWNRETGARPEFS